jgi:L-asparagine transporter-like permease
MDAEILLSYSEKIDSMYLFGIIFLVNFLTNKASNKELNKISETQNFDEKFKLYELFFQKKLIWNFISILLSTLFWISFQKNLFLYIILIQLILTPLFYPRKKLISKELNREDIVFT